MSDGPADSEMRDGEELGPEFDPGEPIALLAEFDHDASTDLLTRSSQERLEEQGRRRAPVHNT